MRTSDVERSAMNIRRTRQALTFTGFPAARLHISLAITSLSLMRDAIFARRLWPAALLPRQSSPTATTNYATERQADDIIYDDAMLSPTDDADEYDCRFIRCRPIFPDSHCLQRSCHVLLA